MVKCSYSVEVETLRPSSFCSSACTRTTRSELPPILKKLSWMPMRSWPSTSAQTACNCCSSSLVGCTAGSSITSVGSGSALRSILPFGVSGNSSSSTKKSGIM